MNKKIFELMKFSENTKELLFATFSSDEYGSWTNTVSGASTHASASRNHLYSRMHYNGNGRYTYGSSASNRTIKDLKRAKSIEFTFQAYRVAETSISNWAGGWDGRLFLLNNFVQLHYTKTSYVLQVNGTNLLSLNESAIYDIKLKQNYALVNNIRYDYSQGTFLKNAPGNECSAYCYMGQVIRNGYACAAQLHVFVGDITAKW